MQNIWDYISIVDCKLEIAHNQTKTTWNSAEQNVLITRQQVATTDPKLLLYKAIFKSIWTYGVQLTAQPPIER